MASFIVLENDIPADYKHIQNVHESWDRSTYNTLKDAIAYAKDWAGPYAQLLPKSWRGKPFNIVNGITIRIKRV